MSSRTPEGWDEFELKEIASPDDRYSFVGGPFGSNLKSDEYTERGVRIIQLQNIGDGEFKDSYKIYTSEEKADELRSSNIYPGDIILSKMGDPVARAALIPTFDNRYLMASDGIRLAINKEKFDAKFIHDAINSADFRTQAELSSTGSTRKRIGLTTLRQLTLVAPSLLEQQKIAAILSSVDNVIKKTRAQIDKLKDLKTGMMQELLTKGIGSGGVPHTEFKDSPVGRIPVSWRVAKLAQVTKVVDSLHQTPTFANEGFPMIRVSDIKPGKVNTERAFKVSQEVFSQFTKNHKPQKGDLLMSRVGSYGVCCYLNRDIDVCLGQNTVVIIPDRVDSLFLYHSIYSEAVQNQIEFEVAGSGYKSLSLASIRSLSIPLPPDDEQKQIADILASIDDQIEVKNRKLKAVSNAKKALMQDLLTGKVRVKTDQKESAVA